MNESLVNKPLVIDYYSDVLCVWAWIAQRRIKELHDTLGNKIVFKQHYMDIFGDVENKMATQWKDRGGYEGFSKHVQHSAASFEDIPINETLWQEVRPKTSANAHLVLKGVEIIYDADTATDIALKIRQAFFVDSINIGELDTLHQLIKDNGLSPEQVMQTLQDGSAMARLMSDYQKAKSLGIKGSPSYVLDGGRQTLYGNVGYRVLLANIEELLKQPEQEASWC